MEAPRKRCRLKFGEIGISPQRLEASNALKKALEQVVKYTSKTRWFITQYEVDQLNELQQKALISISRLDSM